MTYPSGDKNLLPLPAPYKNSRGVSIIQCLICGRIMSGDDVLLGCTTDYIDGPRYAHGECAVRKGFIEAKEKL